MLSTRSTQPTSEISWEYVGLAQIRLYETPYGAAVKLLCYEEEAGELFDVGCEYSQLEYLQPYADLLSDAANGETEPPVIPVYRSNGTTKFAVAGAERDYPELGVIRQRVLDRFRLSSPMYRRRLPS